MMQKKRGFAWKQFVSVILNCLLAVSVTVIAVRGVRYGAGNGQVGMYIVGLGYFKPFTMDSNILAALSSYVLVIYGIVGLIRKEDVTPKWAVTFQLMGTVCLSLTFLVAACFLAPMKVAEGQSYFVMFGNDMFFFHFLNPLLSLLSYLCLHGYEYKKKDCLPAVLPTVVYSVVYLLAVAVFRVWDDFYNFTFGGRFYLIPAVMIVIYALTVGIALLLIRAHNAVNK